jgi:hypothetical protein
MVDSHLRSRKARVTCYDRLLWEGASMIRCGIWCATIGTALWLWGSLATAGSLTDRYAGQKRLMIGGGMLTLGMLWAAGCAVMWLLPD